MSSGGNLNQPPSAWVTAERRRQISNAARPWSGSGSTSPVLQVSGTSTSVQALIPHARLAGAPAQCSPAGGPCRAGAGHASGSWARGGTGPWPGTAIQNATNWVLTPFREACCYFIDKPKPKKYRGRYHVASIELQSSAPVRLNIKITRKIETIFGPKRSRQDPTRENLGLTQANGESERGHI